MRPPLRPPGNDREQILLDAVRHELGRRDLPSSGTGILRAGTSLLVGIPDAGLLARVDRPALAARATRQVQVACLLESLDVPAVRSHDALVHPLVQVDGPVLSLWRWEVVADRVATPAEVGGLAGRLHRATRGAPGIAALAPADPLSAVLDQLAMRDVDDRGATPEPEAVDGDDGLGDDGLGDDEAMLRLIVRQLAPVWAAACEHAPPVLVHADLHAGNVILTADGPLLADLELAGTGPAAYDVAPQVVAERRYGRPPAETAEFLEAYGPDRPDPALVSALAPLYELWVTAWAVSNRGLDDAHEAEARLRLDRWGGDWSSDERPARWTLR